MAAAGLERPGGANFVPVTTWEGGWGLKLAAAGLKGRGRAARWVLAPSPRHGSAEVGIGILIR